MQFLNAFKSTSLIILAMILNSCSVSSNDNNQSKTESLSYSYEVNGCKTEKQQFDSVEKLCLGLQDEQLNHSCAQEYRREMFKKMCPGQNFKAVLNSELNEIEKNDTSTPNQTIQSADLIKSNPDLNLITKDTKLTLLRSSRYDRDTCDIQVFSETIKLLYPSSSQGHILTSLVKPFKNLDLSEFNFIDSKTSTFFLKLEGKFDELKRLNEALKNKQSEVKLTFSKYCASKNQSLILIDSLSDSNLLPQKLDKLARLEVSTVDDKKICSTIYSKTLKQMISEKLIIDNLDFDIDEVLLRYSIKPTSRHSLTGEILFNHVEINYYLKTAPEKLFFLTAIDVQTEVTDSLIEQMSQSNTQVKMTTSTDCQSERLDSSILIYRPLL